MPGKPRNPSKQARRAEEWAKTSRSQEGISWKIILGILGGIGTLVGFIIIGLDFINYLREGYQDFLLLGITVLGIIWVIILYLLVKQRSIYGLLYFAVTLIAVAAIWNGWQSYIQMREDKLIVLIANFDGPEEIYGMRNTILEKLNEDFASDGKVAIESIDEVITPDSDSGSPRARKLGKDFQADIVFWGWYRPTENPNITVHIENLIPEQLLPLAENMTLQPMASLADLESFSFQHKAGQETSALISFLAGYIDYNNEDYGSAIERFDNALKNLSALPELIQNRAEIYFYRANAYSSSNNPELAIQDYDQAIQISPRAVVAYYNRGLSYAARLGEYKRAIQDFDQVLQIDPHYVDAYVDRGLAFRGLMEYERAIQDLNQAIELNPNDARAYGNRGLVYFDMDQYEHAIKDFDKAIELDPHTMENYFNRGGTYLALEQWQRALEDYSKVIELDPTYPGTYFMRRQVYEKLGRTVDAEADYQKFKELIGQKP